MSSREIISDDYLSEFNMLYPGWYSKDPKLPQIVDDNKDSCVTLTDLRQDVPINDPFEEG